jgi:hypothetical protein
VLAHVVDTITSLSDLSVYSTPIITYKGRRIRLSQRMFEILDYATKYPKPRNWHNVGHDEAIKTV